MQNNINKATNQVFKYEYKIKLLVMKTKLCRPVLIEDKNIIQDFPENEYRDYLSLFISKHPNSKASLSLERQQGFMDKINPQQLILISLKPNEKVENSDLIYWESKIYNGKDFIEMRYPVYSDFFKVIATQDQIPPEYIQQFIEEYNKGKVKDVEIEMFEPTLYTEDGLDYKDNIQPKLTNGFITIVEKKSITYTEEEVYELTKEAVGLWRKSLHTTKLYRNKEHHGKWWNEIKKK